MRSTLAAVALSVIASSAQAAGGGIDWVSDPIPCDGDMSSLPGPVVSHYPGYESCPDRGSPTGFVSICRSTGAGPLWTSGAAVAIVGVDILCQVPSGVACVAEIGQAGGDGPDILARTAATGPSDKYAPLLAPIKMPYGTGHFDIYASCDTPGASMTLRAGIMLQTTPSTSFTTF